MRVYINSKRLSSFRLKLEQPTESLFYLFHFKMAKSTTVIVGLALLLTLVTLGSCQVSSNSTATTLATSASPTPDSLGPCRCPASYQLVCELGSVKQGCHGDPCHNNSGPAIITTVCPCPTGYVKTCIPDPPPGCPWSCDTPLNPFAPDSSCDITTSCTMPDPTAVGAEIPASYCACRGGYKADGVADGDTTKQWRLPAPEGDSRVWVAEGVSCNTLCDDPWGPDSCSEVTLLPSECLIFRSQE